MTTDSPGIAALFNTADTGFPYFKGGPPVFSATIFTGSVNTSTKVVTFSGGRGSPFRPLSCLEAKPFATNDVTCAGKANNL